MKKKKTKKNKVKSGNISYNDILDNALDKILFLIEPFCQKYLNEEYWDLCENMSLDLYEILMPLEKGKPQSWASGIVHAIGMINFLQDPSFTPYVESSKIAEAFGVSQNTMLSKSKIIRDEFDIIPLDPRWCLRSLLTDNPLVWMYNVDGLIMDIRNAPREVQEQAYEDGLIPFIPADQIQQSEVQEKSENNVRIIEFPSGKRNKANSEPLSEKDDNGTTLFDKLKD